MNDEVMPHRSRKNRRKWCKGRKGVPHIWRHHQYISGKHFYISGESFNWDIHIDACVVCGRQTNYDGKDCRADLNGVDR